MKYVTYATIFAAILTGCQTPNIPKIFSNTQKKTLKPQKRCKENFTLMNINLYKGKEGYFADLSSYEGEKKHIPLKVLSKEKFKNKKTSQCFISPAAWLMITQPKRFEFYTDTKGNFRYKVKK